MLPINILILIILTLLLAWLVPVRWRGWAILVGSLLAAYWLQPSVPIRNLDFWLPACSVLLVIFVWAVTQPPAVQSTSGRRSWLFGLLAIVGVIIALGLARYLGPACCLTPTRPPELWRSVGLACQEGLDLAADPGSIALVEWQ